MSILLYGCTTWTLTYGKKKLNSTSNIEQVLEAVPHKAVAVRPPITHHENYPLDEPDVRTLLDELISDILLRTPSHWQAKAGRPDRTYIQHVCADTGCSPEDKPGAMDDRDGWWEGVREIRAGDATWWWRKNKSFFIRLKTCLYTVSLHEKLMGTSPEMKELKFYLWLSYQVIWFSCLTSEPIQAFNCISLSNLLTK